MSATSLDELIQSACLRNEFIDKLFEEGVDKRTKTLAGREIFAQKRQFNETVLTDSNLTFWQDSEKKTEDIVKLEPQESIVVYLPKKVKIKSENIYDDDLDRVVLEQVDASTWRARNTLRTAQSGLYYRLAKKTDAALEGRKLDWLATTTATDEGDGWVKVHLPKVPPEVEEKGVIVQNEENHWKVIPPAPPTPKDVEKNYVARTSKDRRLMEVAFPIPDKVQESDIIYKLSREDEDETRGQILKMGYKYRENALASKREIIILHGRLLQRVVREQCWWTIEDFPSVRICILSMPRPSRVRAPMESFMCELFEEALGETTGQEQSLMQTQ
jgi:hypothetical protein